MFSFPPEKRPRKGLEKSVTDHLTIHGVALIRASLSDAEFVAQLQLKFKDFGIEDFEEADEIEADANWEPEDHD